MNVTHMSHRDNAVTHATVTEMSRVSHVPQCHVPREAVPPTRPDPTHIKAGSHSSSGRSRLRQAADHLTAASSPSMNELGDVA